MTTNRYDLMEELKGLYDEGFLKTNYRITIWSALEDVLSVADLQALVSYSKES